MAKVIKKIFLLFVLVSSLLKQLFIALGLFGLSCIKRHPKTVAISTGIALAALCALIPSLFASNSSQASTKIIDNSVKTQNILAQNQKMFTTESGKFENTEESKETFNEPVSALDKLNKTFAEIDGIAFQATHLSGSSSVGRSEPFAPVVGGGELTPGATGENGNALTPEEIAIQKAEERRMKIRDTLNNNVTVKGIVVDTNNKKPLAVVELTKPDGSSEIKTVMPGERIIFADCQAKVTKISQDKISLSSEDVKVDRFIPDFNDDTPTKPTGSSLNTNASSENGQTKSSLIAPPNPNNKSIKPTDNSANGSIGNAKQKIEEIDKLLDSI